MSQRLNLAWSGSAPKRIATRGLSQAVAGETVKPGWLNLRHPGRDLAWPDCPLRPSAVSAGKFGSCRRCVAVSLRLCLPTPQEDRTVSLEQGRDGLPRPALSSTADNGQPTGAPAPCDKGTGSYKVTAHCVMRPFSLRDLQMAATPD